MVFGKRSAFGKMSNLFSQQLLPFFGGFVPAQLLGRRKKNVG
jgi:hypothetical protein